MTTAMKRGEALMGLCLALLTACGTTTAPPEAAPRAEAARSDALLALNCQPPASSIPYCPAGWAGCGSQGGLKPLCCYDDSFGANCLSDPNGNVVVCQPGQVRCGINCAASLTTADCSDPTLQGHCQMLYANPGLCWGNCYDTTTSYCDGNIVCPLGTDCSPGGSTQCPPGQKKCGDTCYSPSTQSCHAGVVCGLEQLQCGGTCFTPGGQWACFKNVLCDRTQYDDSCGGVCINTATDHCVDGVPCPLAKDGVCGGRCFKKSEKNCCGGSDLYDPDVASCCNGEVYSGDVTASCGQCVYAHSQPMGGSCHTDLECSVGKCSNLACGLGGECVCDGDADCGAGMWCDQGTLSIGKNVCKSLKSEGDVCTRGGQCASNCCKLHLATNPFSPVCRPADKC
ncbi:MAG: hypothetical protein IPJ65_16145 [Archangiaceae bacterium]|nr:hypothetical protein [Archangiaceae bacterium]